STIPAPCPREPPARGCPGPWYRDCAGSRYHCCFACNPPLVRTPAPATAAPGSLRECLLPPRATVALPSAPPGTTWNLDQCCIGGSLNLLLDHVGVPLERFDGAGRREVVRLEIVHAFVDQSKGDDRHHAAHDQ